jgi:hypothetical protein
VIIATSGTWNHQYENLKAGHSSDFGSPAELRRITFAERIFQIFLAQLLDNKITILMQQLEGDIPRKKKIHGDGTKSEIRIC